MSVVYGDGQNHIWGGATGNHVTGSDKVGWPEEALSGSGPDRKYVLRMPRFSPAFFSLVVVVPWLPDVTKGYLSPFRVLLVWACATGSCATPVVTEGHVTPSEVSLGCSLRRPRPIFSMVTGTSHPRPDSFFPSYPLRVYNRKSQQRSFYRLRFWWYRGSSENQYGVLY